MKGKLKSYSAVVVYGIVCGLTLPLMFAGTSMQELTLAHKGGNVFGFRFLIAYSIGILLVSVYRLFRRRTLAKVHSYQALAGVFLGNLIMFVNNLPGCYLGEISVFLSGVLIGLGLSYLELDVTASIVWRNKNELNLIDREILLAFTIGAIVALVIFMMDGLYEISVALVCTVLAFFFLRATPLSGFPETRISMPREDLLTYILATLYLVIFSFVYGAISQVASIREGHEGVLAFEAVSSMLVAIFLAMMFVVTQKSAYRLNKIHVFLFPIVALSLIVLPFISNNVIRTIGILLIFTSFYLSNLNCRITICRLGAIANVTTRVYLGFSIGIAIAFMVVGVAFGSSVLAKMDITLGLAMVSLVTLFLLAANAIALLWASQRHEKDVGKAAQADEPEDTGEPPLERRVEALSERQGLTKREEQVLLQLAQGRTRTYIAAEMGVSPNTVKGHMRNLYKKCEVNNKQDLLDML